ncbi:sensor histidine kinase [Herbiconiux sp. SYSU D00978]|uniref:sensor histidine kinase n=1 Tax=Herbiconiux sp. SYSU D00978 TaxID=2812562 RepID=UPI001A96B6D0|nr:sensor histidine kinase [Herbiconiux sp. SYSU D00978]
MQQNVKVWSGVVLAATALFAGVIVAADEGLARSIGGAVALALFLATWFLFGRRGIGDVDGCGQDPRASTTATVLTIGALGMGVASLPELALMQGIVYPLVWTYSLSRRRALVANAVSAVVVFVAFVVALGPAEGLFSGLVTAVVSLGFSLGMGFWISSIAERSTRRQALIDELTATREQLAEAHRDAGVLAERERLARDIHDTVAQSITGVVLLAQRARREQQSADATLPETLAVLEETARAALVEARSVVAALAPVELGSGGIRPALVRLGERFERETGVTVIVDAPEGAELPRESEVVLLRCAQEALANVRKHARARRVTVSFGIDAGRAEVIVQDDGVGFDPAASAPGYGLDGMRERLALAGGRLALDSGEGGTRVAASLPVAAVAQPEVAR